MYLPHARYVLESDMINKEEERRLALLWRYGMCLLSYGRWNEAEELFTQVLKVEKKALGEEHPSTLTSMANLASTYRNQGRWDEAGELEVQVMETRKTKLGADHPDTFAFTWKGCGRYTEALKLMEECTAVSTRMLGTNHPDIVSSRTTLLGRRKDLHDILGEVGCG
jgi:tetratricopeptide (TPR) repeat protein